MTTCVRTFSIINFGIFWKYKSGIQEFPFYSITSSLSGRQALWGATITIFIIEICLTIEFYQTIGVNLLIKYSLLLDVFLSIIEIYLSNTTHHELNTNKSINRKIAIILIAEFNRIMLKEIFADYISYSTLITHLIGFGFIYSFGCNQPRKLTNVLAGYTLLPERTQPQNMCTA